jgi:hypothetical protein
VNATVHITAADEPRADIIEDSAGVPFLLIAPQLGLNGVYVELTHELKENLRDLVKTWNELDEARDHDLAVTKLIEYNRLHPRPHMMDQMNARSHGSQAY